MKVVLCIFFISFNLFALDQVDIDLIDEFSIVSSKVKLHEDAEWGVKEQELDVDNSIYGSGQFKDLNDWENINPNKWFNLSEWIERRKLKDEMPDWRIHLRNKLTTELMGRVIKCIGVCQYFHKTRPILANGQTILREGDEFTTKENSSAWITLVDGTLIRVSANTSISLSEVNISKKEIFNLIRLNHGHVNIIARRQGKFKAVNKVDTDLGFYPLWVSKANREYYARLEYQKFEKEDQFLYEVTEAPGYIFQNRELNNYLINLNANLFEKKSTVYLYTPNLSLKTSGLNVSLYYAINGHGDFKISGKTENFQESDKRVKSAELLLRGYSNKEIITPEQDRWYRVNKKGENSTPSDNLSQIYQSSEGFLKRLTTLYLAREIIIGEYSKVLLSTEDKIELTSVYGYRNWDDSLELPKRKKFLDEYLRRVETTNLVALAKVFKKHKIDKFDQNYYAYAMKKHYMALKGLYSERNKVVTEMNDAQYYLWILRNGK